MVSVYIGIGSNVGIRERYLEDAITLIIEKTGCKLIAVSSVAETVAVDYTDQPDFLNQIIRIETELQPVELLGILKSIEKEIGRIMRFRGGPREIDLDILIYDNFVMDTDTLIIPHPGIMKRDFILRHLVELDPDMRDPLSGKKYSEVLRYGIN